MVRPVEAFNTMLDNVKGTELVKGAGVGAAKAAVGASASISIVVVNWAAENLSRFSINKHTPTPAMLVDAALTAATPL